MPERAACSIFRGAAPVAPVQRIAMRLASLQGMRRNGVAFLLGVTAALALPPVDLTPLLILAFSGLVWLFEGVRTKRAAFGLGWSFGFGFFLAGLYWIAASLFVDITRFWWLVPFAAAGVPAVLALSGAAATLATFLLCRQLYWRGVARILTLAVFWAASEWLRGHILGGFPWNLVGHAWSGGFPGSLAMLQVTSLIGIYGLSLITIVVAMLPASLGDFGGRRWPPLIATGMALALCLAFGAFRLAPGSVPLVPGITLRLIQPAIPENFADGPAEHLAHLREEQALATEPASQKLSAVIWPEGGAPAFLERNVQALGVIAEATPPDGLTLVGTVRTDPAPATPEHVWNTLEAIDGKGAVVAYYDKAHLVPFGEYVPLRQFLPMDKITPGAIDFSPGPGPRTLHLPGLPPFSPLICYEAIFPHRAIDPQDRPQWLLTITNDVWFGFTSGPFQHFDSARIRAVEEGLPLVRDANNGVSGLVDPYGRVLDRMSLNTIGYTDIPLPQALPETPYERLGDWPFLLALPGLLILAWGCARARAGLSGF